MDLISSLSEMLGVPADSAQALAGSVLGNVQDAVRGDDDSAADELGEAIPELEGWKGKAASMLGGGGGSTGGGLGGLLGAAGSAFGGGSGGGLGGALGSLGSNAAGIAGVVAVLGRLGIDEGAPTISADNVGRNDGAPFFGGKTDSSPPDRARHAPSPPSSPPDGRRGAA